MQEANLAAVDLNLLPVFEALFEERSVSRAARRMGISQPAMSRALGRLRGTFGDALFERRPRGWQPTLRALELAPQIRAALANARVALAGDHAFDPGATARRFRIALSDAGEWLLLPRLISSLAGSGIRLQARRLDSLFEAPEAELRNGALDAAVGYFPDARVLGPDLLSETLFEEENLVVMRRGHPAARARKDLPWFASQEHAALILRAEPWGLIDKELAVHGQQRKLRYTSTQALGVLRAVAESNLVACAPERLVREFAPRLGLRGYPLPLPLPKFVTRLVWKRRTPEDAGFEWLRGQFRNAAVPLQT
jgi:DNA-binding transcriptional LysR family regulator